MTTTETQLPKWSEDRRAYARAWVRRKRQADPAFARREAEKAREWQHANPFRNAWNQYRQAATRKGRAWELSREAFERLVSTACHYCGHDPAPAINGIDRIDSGRGYTADNVVTACADCNYAKRNRPVEDFLAWAKRIIDHQEARHGGV